MTACASLAGVRWRDCSTECYDCAVSSDGMGGAESGAPSSWPHRSCQTPAQFARHTECFCIYDFVCAVYPQISKKYTHWAAVALFFFFGARSLYDAITGEVCKWW